MTAEFGTKITILLWRNILKFVVQFFGQTLELIENYVNFDIFV